MADLADVETALRDIVTTSVYPDGVPATDAVPVSPVISAAVRVRRGWPDAAKLDADLKAGIVNVSIFSMPGHSRPIQRYIDDWRTVPSPPPTMTVTQAGAVVTFAGTGGIGQIAGIQLADGTAYAVLATGSPSDAATALAAIVPGATATGPALTLATSAFVARTGGPAFEEKELRRQVQGFRVICWCPSEPTRDIMAATADLALAASDGQWITLPDGTGGLLEYKGTIPDDVPTKESLWKRTLEYTVEYPTMATRQSPPILFPRASFSAFA